MVSVIPSLYKNCHLVTLDEPGLRFADKVCKLHGKRLEKPTSEPIELSWAEIIYTWLLTPDRSGRH